METILRIRESSKDIFTSLPLLLIGFTFLFGTLTSNTGWLWLFLGQILYVPSLALLLNENISDLFSNTFGLALGALCIVLLPLGVSLTKELQKETFESPSIWSANTNIILLLISLGLNYFYPAEQKSLTCSLLPSKEGDTSWTNPSSWTAEILFLASFIFSNALNLFLEPSPSTLPLPGTSSLTQVEKDKIEAKQKEVLDERVSNRKSKAVKVMISISVITIVLLLFRYGRMDCEAGFMKSLFANLTVLSGGVSWFNFVYSTCGVRPADVLGVMTTMIDPSLVNNPIVCIGNPKN